MDLGIIQKLAKCIVRPPRSNYKSSDLAPQCFKFKQKLYEHHEFAVLNNRGLKLQGSYLKSRYSPKPRDTIFFLHANGSCRLIVKNYLETFLPFFDLVAFDFAGCGLSEGEFITLGYNQREDVHTIVKFARKQFGITSVILWGRSMGAATALLYTAKYGEVKAIISDNSYADLQILINQLSDDYLPFLPSFLVDSIINSIQQYIEQILWKKQMTDFNIRKLKPLKKIEKISCPIIFIGSTQDTFVNVKHTKELYTRTKTPKWLELVSGNHNDPRSVELKEKILQYLQEIHDNHITSAKVTSKKERVGMFQEMNSPSINKTSPKVVNSPMDVKLVNCAEMEFQTQNPIQSKSQEKVSRDLSSMDSSGSEKKSRESYLQRKMKEGEKYKRNRSRSGIKRKKIFQGIDLISEHLNGQQN